MNLMHLKYAVEVARAGSINKAAETLLMGQPNLSRAIKELEASIGITIFERSAKGMMVTLEGKEFLGYAQKILRQVEEVENIYKNGGEPVKRFSVSVPRASYISAAFAEFTLLADDGGAEFLYKETNSLRTINSVIYGDYSLGIIRYAAAYDKYFSSMLEGKGLLYKTVSVFTNLLLMSNKNPLAYKKTITSKDLREQTEIANADLYVPYLPQHEVKKDELPVDVSRRIHVFERASQFDILSKNRRTFMRVSAVPEELCMSYGLVQKKCADDDRQYKDVLIYRRDHRLSALEKAFLEKLEEAKKKYLDQSKTGR